MNPINNSINQFINNSSSTQRPQSAARAAFAEQMARALGTNSQTPIVADSKNLKSESKQMEASQKPAIAKPSSETPKLGMVLDIRV